MYIKNARIYKLLILDIFSYLETSQQNIKVSLEFIEQFKHAQWLISFVSSINRLKCLMQHALCENCIWSVYKAGFLIKL